MLSSNTVTSYISVISPRYPTSSNYTNFSYLTTSSFSEPDLRRDYSMSYAYDVMDCTGNHRQPHHSMFDIQKDDNAELMEGLHAHHHDGPNETIPDSDNEAVEFKHAAAEEATYTYTCTDTDTEVAQQQQRQSKAEAKAKAIYKISRLPIFFRQEETEVLLEWLHWLDESEAISAPDSSTTKAIAVAGNKLI
jgi:hypothetical protein